MIGESVGSYRVISKLGEGGMGAVYIAQHVLLGKKAAVKVLHPQLSADQEFVTRFFNEARAATLIEHPGLVDVFDFGYLPGGAAFLVMELLDGESLAARLRHDGRITGDLLLDVARQVASALGAAHSRGIVHRDLKPDNLFLVPDADRASGVRVKILDFGIAKLSEEVASGVKTRTGVLMGTPIYMSPEQCRGAGAVDHRSDIYSLGCILFEMAAGRPPFVAVGAGELIAAHLFEPPPSLRELAPEVSAPVAAMIARMLAKKPEERHANLAELIAELDGGVTRPSKPRTPAASHASSPTIRASTTLSRSVGELAAGTTTPRRRSWLWPIAGALVVAGGAGLWFGVLRPQPASPVPPVVPVATPAPVPPPRVEPPPPRRVKITVDSTPAGAEVYRAVDSVLMGRTPWTEQRAATDGAVSYVLKLPGYRDGRAQLPADRDGTTRVTLVRERQTVVHPKVPKEGAGGPSTTVIDPFVR